MSNIVDQLVNMGFEKTKAELAVSKTEGKSVEDAMDWILSHEDEQPTVPETAPATSTTEIVSPDPETNSEPAMAKSIKCEECGKLFQNQTEVEFHAAKSGHDNFSESTEEKKPLSDEEKREQLAKIEAKLRQRRLEREAREKQEELEREKNRIRSGKEMLEAKKKQEDAEIRKMVEQRKREKEEERLARQRVKEQIEQDKLMRKAKFGGQPLPEKPPETPVAVVVKAPSQTYSEVKLQIRLTNGSALTQTFGVKEPLSAVRVFVELNRTDEPGPFTLMTTFPRNVFKEDDYDKPLDLLGLAPSAVLIVNKS